MTQAMLSKSELRKLAREKRKAFPHPDIGAALASHAAELDLVPGDVVGGYHALPHEADPAQLLQALVTWGCHVAFPRIAGEGLKLEFHRVPGGEALKPGAYGIHEPAADWPSVTPDLLLVPLLAFDRSGHRLGYGGGYYDRTLFFHRSRAIGIAYAAQEVDAIPAEHHDMRLDGVLTEAGLILFAS